MRIQQFISYFIIIIVLTICLPQKTIQMEKAIRDQHGQLQQNGNKQIHQNVDQLGQTSQHHSQNVDQTGQTYQHHGQNVDQTGQTSQHHSQNVDQLGQTSQHHSQNVDQLGQTSQHHSQNVDQIGQTYQHHDQINQNQFNYSHYQPDQNTKNEKTLNSDSLKRAHSVDLDSPQKKSNNDGHFSAYLTDQQHLQTEQNYHDQKNEQTVDREAATMSRHKHHPSFDVWDQFVFEESLLMGSNPEEALLQEPDDYLVPNPFAAVILQDQLPKHYFTEFTPGHTVPKDKTESSSSHTVDSSTESNPDLTLTKHKNLPILKIKLQEAELNHSLSPTTVLNPGTAPNSPMLRNLSTVSNSSTPNSPMLRNLSTLSNSATPNSPKLRNLSTGSNSSTPNSPMLRNLSTGSNSSTPNSPMLRNLSTLSNSSTPNSPMHRNLSTVPNSSTGKLHVSESLTTDPQSTVSTMMSPLYLSASACNTQKNKCTTTVPPSTVTFLKLPASLDATPTGPMNTVPILTAPNSMRTLAINTPVNLLPMGQSTTVQHATVPNSLRPLSFDGQTLSDKLDVARLTTELAKLTIVSTIAPLFNTKSMDYDLEIILKMNLACLIINNSELNLQQIPENAANSSFGHATKTTFVEIFAQSIVEHFGEHKEHVPSVIRNANIYLKIYKTIYKMHTGVEITKNFLKKSVKQLVVVLREWQKRMPTNGLGQIEDKIFQNEFFEKHCEHLNKKY